MSAFHLRTPTLSLFLSHSPTLSLNSPSFCGSFLLGFVSLNSQKILTHAHKQAGKKTSTKKSVKLNLNTTTYAKQQERNV